MLFLRVHKQELRGQKRREIIINNSEQLSLAEKLGDMQHTPQNKASKTVYAVQIVTVKSAARMETKLYFLCNVRQHKALRK
jgi:hypothetical protein